MKTDIL